ncbi:MAG: acyltransferase family protein [Pseudomonadota bacterium]
MKYRAEIDGLRAVAVVPVILFHAGFDTFSGGYVGVDVFFVISGYLITTILLEDMERGRFSLLNFYERRARRILPALFFVMIACIPFAWMWMLPDQMKDFAKSLVAVSLFASNILFARESGYFAPLAEEKPLLHTWSLAVEEQYYLLFPVFLILVWRFGRNRVFWTIAALAALSLLLAEWGWRNEPLINFYFTPSRAWELFAGSLAAFIVQRRGVQTNNVLSLLGLLAIGFAVLTYDGTVPFPSVYALVPIMGVVLLILYASADTWAARLLSTRALVGVGLISYSAYLWHQPLFAFARIKGFHSSAVLGGLAVAAMCLAVLSWRYVEQPFRNKSKVSRTNIFALSVSGLVAFSLLGYAGHRADGFKSRLSEDQVAFFNHFENDLPEWRYFMHLGLIEKYWAACNFYDIEAFRAGTATTIPVNQISHDCTADTRDQDQLFIWGDSHAQQFTHGIRESFGDSFAIRQIASSGCNPKIVMQDSATDYCARSNFKAISHITETKPKIVLVAQAQNHDVDHFDRLVGHLRQLGVSKVVIMGPTPQWDIDLPKILVRDLDDVPRRLAIYRRLESRETNENLRDRFGADDRVIFVDVIDAFCDDAGCLVYFGDDVAEGITSWDYGHLTPIASEYVARRMGSRLTDRDAIKN